MANFSPQENERFLIGGKGRDHPITARLWKSFGVLLLKRRPVLLINHGSPSIISFPALLLSPSSFPLSPTFEGSKGLQTDGKDQSQAVPVSDRTKETHKYALLRLDFHPILEVNQKQHLPFPPQEVRRKLQSKKPVSCLEPFGKLANGQKIKEMDFPPRRPGFRRAVGATNNQGKTDFPPRWLDLIG
jgi:hypothetical protein